MTNTKDSPSEFDGYTKALPDEPTFTLLARDPQAPQLIRQWARDRRLREGTDTPKTESAFAIADAMDTWRMAQRPTEGDAPKDGERVPDQAEFSTDYRSNIPVTDGERVPDPAPVESSFDAGGSDGGGGGGE